MEEASSSSSSSSSCTSPRAAPWVQIAVHGVPLSATEEDLKNHFGRYGQVLAAVEDAYGKPQDSDGKQVLVHFADSASAKRASASREKNNHIILGKLVEVSRLSIWLQQRRIEVKNLPPGTTSSQFRAYFEEFGTVTEAVVKPDGSSYVVFKCDESLRKVLRKKLHLFYGTELKVRRESPYSEAFLFANAVQHESAGATSSATPYAHGVVYIPTRPVHTDSTPIATTPYDALYTPSYNQPTTSIRHAYSTAPTNPFGTHTPSDNRPISTTYTHGAPSISPYGVPSTPFYQRYANVSNGKKIFVGGLPTDITYDEFRAYFEKFGPITNAFVPIDKNINRTRGFGFVTFETEESADEVLMHQFHEMRPDKFVEVKKAIPKIEGNIRRDNNNNGNGVSSSNNIIDGHKVDVKQAELKETRTAESSRNSSSNTNVPNKKKIFVGGLPTDITDDEFRTYFEKFGRITDAFVVLKDNRPWGFGFVTFETEESAHEVLKNLFHEMRPDKKVVVKKAIPKKKGNI